MFLAAGCLGAGSSSSNGCEEGAEGCTCYPNDTCDDGLECLSSLCVDPDDEETDEGSSDGVENDAGDGSDETDADDTTDEARTDAGNTTDELTPGETDASEGSTDATDEPVATDEGSQATDASGTDPDPVSTDEPATTDTAMTDVPPDMTETDVVATDAVATDVGMTDTMETDVGTGDEVSDPAIIDDFGSCDGAIARVAGRDGGWYTYGDLDVNLTPNTSGGAEGASTPPTGFEDSSCAAWVTGGCDEGALDCTFGGIGFTFLAGADPYDISDYSGITFGYEGDDMWVQVLDANGGGFGVIVDGSPGTRSQRTVYFEDMVANAESLTSVLDLSAVTDVQFATVAPDAFGQAIYEPRLF